MSLTKRSWLPICSRKKAMREITEIHEEKRREAARNEMTRSNERQRHLIEEHRFRDIILRVQGYIQPDGTRVMPVGHGLNDRPETVEMVSVTMENATSSIMVYARLNTFMIQRYGLLSPADYRLIAEAVGNRVAAETTKIIADGKMKSA